jgi:hypothetical protein
MEMYRLELSDGSELMASGGHPIAGPRGFVLARDLTKGAEVLTRDGSSTIKAIDPLSGQSRVYNLTLANDLGRKGEATFYANGVAVGDNETQWKFDKRRAKTAAPVE